MKIQYLPHTADIRMSIEASSLSELFGLSLKGMANIIKEDFCRDNSDHGLRLDIRVDAPDRTCLLIDFLSEVLSLSYVHKAVFCEADFIEISDYSLHAEIAGSQIETYDEEIKAVTYHEAAVEQSVSGNWQTIIVFDI